MRQNQQGAALIVALFVVALVSAAAVFMIDRLQTDIRRTELILNADKAYLAAAGSVAWAIDTLTQNYLHKQDGKVIDRTPIRSTQNRVDNMIISGTIYDAQGFFNINNLVSDPRYLSFFSMLITQVSSNQLPPNIAEIVTNTANWITQGVQNNELAEFYLKSNPSYRVPNRLMVSMSELRMVKGVTATLFHNLSPYLIALPSATLININNVSVPVLKSVTSLSDEDARNVIKILSQTPVANEQQLKSFNLFKEGFDNKLFTFNSDYFFVETNVKVGEQNLLLYTLLKRTIIDNKPSISILWQSRGTL